MEQPSRNQILLRQYLMGEMPERERDDLEEKYFSDDDLFGEMLGAEDQLVDDYRRGQLSPRDRERFERRFLTLPDRRRKVEFDLLFAESLAERRAARQPSPNAEPGARRQPLFGWLRLPQSIPKWTMAAASLIVALGAVWMALNISRRQFQPMSIPAGQAGKTEQTEQARPDQAREARVRVEEELANLQTRPVPAKGVIALALVRGASRSSEEIKTITPGAETTRLEFILDAGAENYAGYQASLQRADDESVEALVKQLEVKTTAAGKSVTVKLPATMLETDDYQIKLEGIGPQGDTTIIGKYLFKIRRQ